MKGKKMDSEAIYHRVEASQVIPDRDLVIEIVPAEAGPLATITDPKSLVDQRTDANPAGPEGRRKRTGTRAWLFRAGDHR